MTTTPARNDRALLVSAGLLVVFIVLIAAGAFIVGLSAGRGGGSGGSSVDGACEAPSEAFDPLCETYARIKADYVDEVGDEELVRGAVDGMVEALPDAYSGYLPPEQYESALANLSGEFSGIGAEVGIENVESPEDSDDCAVITNACAMVVVAPLDGTPADEAGLRSGDVILAVDGEPTLGSTLQAEVLEVRGESGTDVTLTIGRGERELDITITRGVIELDAVTYRMIEDGIGSVRLATFSSDASDEFRAGLQSLLDDGATAIVFDLRDNPGGFINAAQEVASQFLEEGLLIFTQESGEEVVEWRSEGGVAADPSIEVAVLINEGSASASEIVAAALKEHDRATLVGESTFGKNTVQSWSELRDGGGLKLTTDRWFTPDHDSVAGDGIEPDVAVQAPDETPIGEEPASDPILDRAVELLSG